MVKDTSNPGFGIRILRSRFEERRNGFFSHLETMLREGTTRETARQWIQEIGSAVRGGILSLGELEITEIDLASLEDAAVKRYLRGLVRRLRTKPVPLVNGVAWKQMILAEVSLHGPITWDSLETNGNELDRLIAVAGNEYDRVNP